MPRPGLVVISRTVKALFRVRSRAGGPDQAKAGTLVRALGTGLLTFSRFFFYETGWLDISKLLAAFGSLD
jgi:hypothetical protein